MRTIYLVRHGQTLFNVHHKIQGTCDSPLTELGKAQAEAVRQYFCKSRLASMLYFVQNRKEQVIRLKL